MRGNIYIGLGGSGIKTVDAIKQQFYSDDFIYNIASAFCAIDTDREALSNCGFLSAEELVDIGVVNPRLIYTANKDKFDIPDKNIHYLSNICNSGSGQVRSNGHFCFLHNDSFLRNKILSVYHELTNTKSKITISNIDVHLFFSSCGGTGSGIFYDIAKLIKEIIPNSNIICYAYSHRYFEDITPFNCLIKSNEYATLLETNYYFNNNSRNYALNKFVFIDNKTYDEGGKFHSYVIQLSDSISYVAKALYLSSITNFELGTSPFGASWISSFGFSEILNFEEIKKILLKQVSCRELEDFLEFKSAENLEDIAKQWLEYAGIVYDSQNDTDNLSELIISPSLYAQIQGSHLIRINNSGYIDDRLFRQQNSININVAQIVELFSNRITSVLESQIYDSLFPVPTEIRLGLYSLKGTLYCISLFITHFNGCHHCQVSKLRDQISQLQKDEHRFVETLVAANNHIVSRILPHRQGHINNIKDNIKKGRLEKLKIEYKIQSHEISIYIYEEVLRKVSVLMDSIDRLTEITINSIRRLETELFLLNQDKGYELTATQTILDSQLYKIKNLQHYYQSMNVDSFEGLAHDWSEHMQNYIDRKCLFTNSVIESVLNHMGHTYWLNLIQKKLEKVRPLIRINSGVLPSCSTKLFAPHELSFDINFTPVVSYISELCLEYTHNLSSIFAFSSLTCVAPIDLDIINIISKEFNEKIRKLPFSLFTTKNLESNLAANNYKFE